MPSLCWFCVPWPWVSSWHLVWAQGEPPLLPATLPIPLGTLFYISPYCSESTPFPCNFLTAYWVFLMKFLFLFLFCYSKIEGVITFYLGEFFDLLYFLGERCPDLKLPSSDPAWGRRPRPRLPWSPPPPAQDPHPGALGKSFFSSHFGFYSLGESIEKFSFVKISQGSLFGWKHHKEPWGLLLYTLWGGAI